MTDLLPPLQGWTFTWLLHHHTQGQTFNTWTFGEYSQAVLGAQNQCPVTLSCQTGPPLSVPSHSVASPCPLTSHLNLALPHYQWIKSPYLVPYLVTESLPFLLGSSIILPCLHHWNWLLIDLLSIATSITVLTWNAHPPPLTLLTSVWSPAAVIVLGGCKTLGIWDQCLENTVWCGPSKVTAQHGTAPPPPLLSDLTRCYKQSLAASKSADGATP